jgi:hypothetical protein
VIGKCYKRHRATEFLDFLTAARAALAALPHNLPLSVNAAITRDGTDAAATPGLPRYRGRIQ